MATLLLSAAGSALGGALGGSFAGLSTMALGKAAGALLGSGIDKRLLGAGSEPVETGKVERFRVMGSSEGASLARAFGRVRLPGQLIWSSRFLESVSTEQVGGKGGSGSGATVREYSYTVSLAVALCEGEVSRIGRIWADGQPLDQSGLTFRLHPGSEDQVPDPLIAAIEDAAPAYRGTAYVVIENLALAAFGNRIPQFNFEVFRRPAVLPSLPRPPALDVRGVALVPGTGEYALATEPVRFRRGIGESVVANVHNDRGLPDILASLDQLTAELPNTRSVSLVVTWFGDDLRCDRCTLRPAVEQTAEDGDPMPWVVAGQSRHEAVRVSRRSGRPVFGGTPADASVVQAIRHLRSIGQSVMFYPFVLMDIQAGNGLLDPWTGAADQPAVPWRGRITLADAPGRPGSSDRTPAAADEVRSFFGAARAPDFSAAGDTVAYHGPAEWSYRRFVLHYAHLCALAGGVDAFCVGSELRSLTQIRDGTGSYPAVTELELLAAEVREILGPSTKIGYAADWSEYFGHHPDDGSGDVAFNLDPLWASPAIDFIGIDNYMPLSDWRDGVSHADAAAGSIYDLAYLTANVAGGEGYDWYYADREGRDEQNRLPIVDGTYGEHWVFRYKDIVNWWSQPHHNRIGGSRSVTPTGWRPRSKPIWFTELGCPAVDKGTNQPNVFYDPKSSESFFPYYSNGSRDEFVQYRYLQAMYAHWNDPANNPLSDVYEGRMVDVARAHVWAWDARPWPDFPDRDETWADGANHARGHWLTGRASLAGLDQVIAELCARGGAQDLDVTRVYGAVTGYTVEAVESGRQSLQPLALAYSIDSFAVDGRMGFAARGRSEMLAIEAGGCVQNGRDAVVSHVRSPVAETADRVTVGFVRADLDYLPGAVGALAPDAIEPRSEQMALSLVLSEGEAAAVAERALVEGRIGRDRVTFSLPPSGLRLCAADLIRFSDDPAGAIYRIDRIDDRGAREVTAVRAEPSLYAVPVREIRTASAPRIKAPAAPHALLLDLPLLNGTEDPYAPYLAVTAMPWSAMAVFSSNADAGYRLEGAVRRPAVIGTLLDALPAAPTGVWTRTPVRVRVSGTLQSRSEAEVLNGANAAALRFGDLGDWEVVQFLEAELTSPREYLLRGLLRGQAGTDGVMPAEWPAGTTFVLLDATLGRVSLPASQRGVERHFRIGPAVRGYDDPSYRHLVETVLAVGLRPYRPAHLRATRHANGAIEVSWIRRTRVDGDSWLGTDVPLGEESEAYLVRVLRAGTLVREVEVDRARWSYAPGDQFSDGGAEPLVFQVAQLSGRFGPGPFEEITFHV